MRHPISKLALLGIAGLLACTAIVSTDAVQCANDGDCAKRGPDFTNTVCGANGVCVAGNSSSVDAGPKGECAQNSDCSAKGAGMVCSSNLNKCVPLESDDCKLVYGDASKDGTLLFGLLSEIGADDSNYFRQQQHVTAAKLAFSEFFDAAGVSFPGGHKAALVACTEHFPRKTAAHLANLGIKALIGPSAEDRQRAVIETLLPARIASFTPWINGNPASVVPGSTGFAWLAAFQRADVVAPLNALVAEREAMLRAGGKTKVRVAVVVNESEVPEAGTPSFNSFGEYGDLMDQRLVFNGKTAVENQNDPGCTGNACYKRFVTNQAVLETVKARADDIAAFKPDLILPFADIDWGAQLLPALEAKFELLPVAERPSYVHTFLQNEDAGYKSLKLDDATLRARVTGVRPLRDNSFEVFSNKFRAAYTAPSDTSKAGPPPNTGAGRAFETSLLLLFTTYAALVEKPTATPEDVVAALPKTTDPAATKITLNDIVAGVGQLNSKASINFDGLFTFFEFDTSSHSAPATWTTWCLGADSNYNATGRVFNVGNSNVFDGNPAACP